MHLQRVLFRCNQLDQFSIFIINHVSFVCEHVWKHKHTEPAELELAAGLQSSLNLNLTLAAESISNANVLVLIRHLGDVLALTPLNLQRNLHKTTKKIPHVGNVHGGGRRDPLKYICS